MLTDTPALRRSQGNPVRPSKYAAGRRLVVVDIENLIGGAVLTAAQAEWAKVRLTEVLALTAADQVVIGTSHIGLLSIGTTWENQRYVVQSGEDGADLALLDVLAEDLHKKYDEVILASGDGIFTDAVDRLAAAGVAVRVVAPADGLSRRLRIVAKAITSLSHTYADLKAAS